jgi:excisionase family DNA binding protein
MKKNGQTLSVREIAEQMGVTDATVRVWINCGKLPAYKLPGSGAQCIIRVRREDFEQFLRIHRSTTVCA